MLNRKLNQNSFSKGHINLLRKAFGDRNIIQKAFLKHTLGSKLTEDALREKNILGDQKRL